MPTQKNNNNLTTYFDLALMANDGEKAKGAQQDRQIGKGHIYRREKPKGLNKIDKLAKVTNTG
jgi:hypothetical protein